MFAALYRCFHRAFSRADQAGEYSGGRWQELVRRQALALCRGKPGKVLEVGCGEGLFLKSLLEEDPRRQCWGIDLSQERIARAQQRLADTPAQLSAGDATRLTFGDKYFDLVVCINVFFNLPSAETVAAVLGQMRRVLNDQGTIIFDFRNAENVLLRWKYRLAPWYDPTVKELPLRTYSRRQIEALLAAVGLAVVKSYYPGSQSRRCAPLILIEARKI